MVLENPYGVHDGADIVVSNLCLPPYAVPESPTRHQEDHTGLEHCRLSEFSGVNNRIFTGARDEPDEPGSEG